MPSRICYLVTRPVAKPVAKLLGAVHWAIMVDGNHFDINGDNTNKTRTRTHDTALIEDYHICPAAEWKALRLGDTAANNATIKWYADQWCEQNPTYHLENANCQHFVRYVCAGLGGGLADLLPHTQNLELLKGFVSFNTGCIVPSTVAVATDVIAENFAANAVTQAANLANRGLVSKAAQKVTGETAAKKAAIAMAEATAGKVMMISDVMNPASLAAIPGELVGSAIGGAVGDAIGGGGGGGGKLAGKNVGGAGGALAAAAIAGGAFGGPPGAAVGLAVGAVSHGVGMAVSLGTFAIVNSREAGALTKSGGDAANIPQAIRDGYGAIVRAAKHCRRGRSGWLIVSCRLWARLSFNVVGSDGKLAHWEELATGSKVHCIEAFTKEFK